MNKENKIVLVSFVFVAIVAAGMFAAVFSEALATNDNGQSVKANVEIHAWVKQYRNGQLISQTYHPMTLTDAGKAWIKENLFNSGGTNVTKFAMYIGASADSTAVSTAWNTLPAEITANGCGRALGTYTSTGTGTCNITVTYSVSGTQTTQLYGLYYDTYANAPASTLVAAEQQGAGSAKNLVSGDSLQITVQGTIS